MPLNHPKIIQKHTKIFTKSPQIFFLNEWVPKGGGGDFGKNFQIIPYLFYEGVPKTRCGQNRGHEYDQGDNTGVLEKEEWTGGVW